MNWYGKKLEYQKLWNSIIRTRISVLEEFWTFKAEGRMIHTLDFRFLMVERKIFFWKKIWVKMGFWSHKAG